MKKIWLSFALALVLSMPVAVPVFAADTGRVHFGGSIEVPPDQVVDGDVVAFGGNVNIAGQVIGDATAFGGNVDISGEVTGQVISFGGNVHLAPTAKVYRGVTVVGGTLQREEGSEVRGKIVETGPGGGAIPHFLWPGVFSWHFYTGPGDAFAVILAIMSAIITAIALAAIALLAAVIFPTQLDVVRRTIESAPLQVVGVGVLSTLVSIMLTPILIFTCIGLPLFWLAVTLATLFGSIALGLLVGERLLLALKVRGITMAWSAVVGILVIWIASLFPILGGIMMLFVFFFGLGAVVLSRFGTISPPFSWQSKGPSGPPPATKE
ncbi:MAG: polymer-forming cytoskeletal protein [Dehalococcoidales bacterium]|nr:polymer-forming cytoskeletal protein [Dehalococcoidales bacterium]